MAEQTFVADRTSPALLDRAEKRERYEMLVPQLESLLREEDDLLAGMASVACVLHNAFSHFYWTGFYRRVAPDRLLVGPYQGTLGCLHIPFDRGVCGAAAREERTVVVPDVNLFPGHIACDAASASEIVVPVFDAERRLVAVLDVDSTLPAAFDGVDAECLERIVALLAPLRPAPLVWR